MKIDDATEDVQGKLTLETTYVWALFYVEKGEICRYNIRYSIVRR